MIDFLMVLACICALVGAVCMFIKHKFFQMLSTAAIIAEWIIVLTIIILVIGGNA